ncbi:MAG TPA: LuxR C-terminal-related transcriptional regulator [Symbiobacteriaceae bacterium]|nr:LuxR C-terminal-related transcriptional regulator [Symbiobacteriaceae bacterium]
MVFSLSLPRPDTSAWLVATKLHPPLLRSDTIRRPQLEAALSRSVSTLPLTLLSAPAGYGKTTLLALLPHLLPDRKIAWVSLDEEDNDPIRFLGLVTTALQRLHPDCGRSVWTWLAGGGADSASVKRAAGALAGDVLTCLPDPFVLVLDDLHTVMEPAVHVALEYLLEHLPPQMHIAVGTRHDPPLRLARLAARRQLAELRRPDLGFRPDETRLLLNDTLGLSLAPADVAALQERTEGWPAGLCLLAGPLGRLGSLADRARFMAAVTHSERQALDFLAEEVLAALDSDRRDFLLRTSVLMEMTPSLCRALTGREDAGQVLEQLYRQNLTIASITAEAEGEPVYRHHALFARLLARQLERELPGEIVELHRRAALAQVTPGRAIYHSLAAGLWEQAADLMARSGMELLSRGMTETIRQWHRALPAQTQALHPRLTVLMARCEIQNGEYAAAERLLIQARTAFADAGDTAGECEAVSSLITLAIQHDDRPQAGALVARALELPKPPQGQVAARLARAWLHEGNGEWEACRAAMAEALAIPRATGSRMAAFVGLTYMTAPMIAVPGCLELVEQFCADLEPLVPPGSALRLGADELAAWTLLLRGHRDEALARARAADALRRQIGGWPVLGCDAALLVALLCPDQAEAVAAAEMLVQRAAQAPRSRQSFYLHGAAAVLARAGRRADPPATALPAHAAALLAPSASPGAGPDPLTQREEDVLRLLVAGYTNRQIGSELFITEETVKSHVARILRKLDATSRTQAAMRGRELGF